MAALAQLLGLAQTQVYEVATFYHHFDVVKENPDGSLARSRGADGTGLRWSQL